jgi:hypothetical protein
MHRRKDLSLLGQMPYLFGSGTCSSRTFVPARIRLLPDAYLAGIGYPFGKAPPMSSSWIGHVRQTPCTARFRHRSVMQKGKIDGAVSYGQCLLSGLRRSNQVQPSCFPGQKVICPHCDADLEVISVEPLELDWAYDWSWEDEEEEDE